MAMTADLLQLLEHDIPQGRKHLQDSHVNLEKVATYCEGNYLQSRDKRYALDETKNFTTQSLASVAYQINTLASHFLNLLDFQFNQMAAMESNINHLSQTVMIHKEKVARREIGVLTTNKTTTRPPGMKTGIIFPEQPERPIKYVRKNIDYNVLDELGHGVKSAASQVQQRPRRPSSSSSQSGGPNGRDSMRGAPTTKPPTPPLLYKGPQGAGGPMSATIGSGGTLSRQTSAVSQASSSPYRTPAPPVSPPSLPMNYAPSYPVVSQQQQPIPQASQSDRRSGYASVKNMGGPPPPMSQAPPPPMGMVYPISHGLQQGGAPNTPPLPPMPGQLNMDSYQDLPPPPDENTYATAKEMQIGNVSPPLPPPPEGGGGGGEDHQFNQFNQFNLPPNFEPGYGMARGQGPGGRRAAPVEDPGPYGTPIPRYARQQSDQADWIPPSYLEKVVAIYDYAKDKDDELSFNEGAVIYVIKKNDDGWYEGVLDGQTGLFPGNYVEELSQR